MGQLEVKRLILKNHNVQKMWLYIDGLVGAS
jgi:hypothetical protein